MENTVVVCGNTVTAVIVQTFAEWLLATRRYMIKVFSEDDVIKTVDLLIRKRAPDGEPSLSHEKDMDKKNLSLSVYLDGLYLLLGQLIKERGISWTALVFGGYTTIGKSAEEAEKALSDTSRDDDETYRLLVDVVSAFTAFNVAVANMLLENETSTSDSQYCTTVKYDRPQRR